MAMKIDVGVCKKVGLPDYGSAGAHCDITLEADISVLNNPDEFQERVRHAYGLCRQAIKNELARLGGKAESQNSSNKASDQRERVVQTERKLQPACNARALPSDKQKKFIGQLVRGIKGLDNKRLDAYCEQEFGKSSQQLSAQDASKLIDMLKEAKENGGLAT